MDYFKILNLDREPFSNSPEPGLFYQSSQHLDCLQKLELAIRLHRGLNVVMGDVGTGKTTLCRELIIRFAKSQEDRNTVETHLLLDPSTNTPLEFLKAVATAFGSTGASPDSEWSFKEAIKNYLYQQGVTGEKTVILLIDEGQKLPPFALEILREFLNYETNEAKLLQIVIFAQNEFRDALLQFKNFADRANQLIYLGPLNFRETARMIEYRIAQAGGGRNTHLFTWPGLLAVYRASKGYPRRIIAICHQSILAMIIQNRKKAGWFTVRSCAQRVAVETESKKIPFPVKVSIPAFLILAAVLIWYWPLLQHAIFHQNGGDTVNVTSPPPAPLTTIRNAPSLDIAPPAPVVAPPKKPSAVIANKTATPVAPVSPSDKPKTLGSIQIQACQNTQKLLQRVYGAYSNKQLQAFISANPLIKNVNILPIGEKITFPAIPAPVKPLPKTKTWIVLMSKKTLEEALQGFANWPDPENIVRLIPYWNHREGLVFAFFLKNGFTDKATAEEFIKKMPVEYSMETRIISSFPDETEFYAN
jgi:general secretion pathway protein A